MIELSRVDSPLGILTVAVAPRGLRALHLGPEDIPGLEEPQRQAPSPPKEIAEALTAYFAGDFTWIDALPVSAEGTDFQKKVWAMLRTIRAGTTWTYAQLAVAIGNPASTRAVGAANGKNPIAIVVPCHRVIASNGTLHGYAGGLEKKKWLLSHERSWPAQAKLSL